jgi:polyphosphate kinase
MIQNEIKMARQGKPAQIIAKMNSFEDNAISHALYQASQAGVKIVLIVRGFCSLKPRLKGLSDNIQVISVIGRFLEHSRVFYFRAGATKAEAGNFYIGSADWMHRNLHRRVEVVVPITSDKNKKFIYDYLNVFINDKKQAWDMNEKGQYVRRSTKPSKTKGSHQYFMDYYSHQVK